MNPTYIETVIYRPGVLFAPLREDSETLSLWNDPNVYLDEALGGRIYSVTRDKMIEEGEQEVDAAGKLTETLFVVTGMTEVRECAGITQNPWLREYMGACGFQDLEEGNMAALYEIAVSLLPKEPDEYEIVPVSFLGDWIIHTSQGHEDPYPEIDMIEFAGRYEAVPAKELEENTL